MAAGNALQRHGVHPHGRRARGHDAQKVEAVAVRRQKYVVRAELLDGRNDDEAGVAAGQAAGNAGRALTYRHVAEHYRAVTLDPEVLGTDDLAPAAADLQTELA